MWGFHNIPRLLMAYESLMLNWVAPRSTPPARSSRALRVGVGGTLCRRAPARTGRLRPPRLGAGAAHRQRPVHFGRRPELACASCPAKGLSPDSQGKWVPWCPAPGQARG